MNTIQKATASYEAWILRYTPLLRADVAEKHRRMRLGPFYFMRGSFYRWCQLWRASAGDLGRATRILAVGDLHLENFGTWRDADGRLVWGINDFDEATVLPWTMDLVRLATSAHLAIVGEHLAIGRRAATDAILDGYRNGIEAGGRPFVLEEEHGWLRRLATSELRDPVTFWERLGALPTARAIDPEAAAAIAGAMPARGLAIRYARRVAGVGSLGRPRFVGIADWHGGLVARQARSMAPSAWVWARGKDDGDESLAAVNTIIDRAVRVPDPTLRVVGRWLIRRLAPHCTRIELDDLPDSRNEERLLHAMGFETANVHLGAARAVPRLRQELRALKGRWLFDAAKDLAADVVRDWRRFCAG
jgi:hypothetical protein